MIEEVLLFSREYINDRTTRSADRKRKIIIAYMQATGEPINGTCSTCIIEALLKIIRMFKTVEIKPIMNSKYQLKLGVLISDPFGDESKVMTQDTLNRLPKDQADELAEYHLRKNPSIRRFFAVIPGEEIPKAPHVNPGMTIIIPPEPPIKTARQKALEELDIAYNGKPEEVIPETEVTPEIKDIIPVVKKTTYHKKHKR
jgi:hypothetical protein